MSQAHSNGTASVKGKRVKGPHGLRGGSPEANRLAVVILEVLAGLRSPGQAARALGLSPPRYYQLELRALEGMVAALEPRPLGKRPSPEGRLAKLERQLQQAQHENARQQALVRALKRSLGLKPAEPQPAKGASSGASPRRRPRRPTVRALKAAEALQKNLRSAAPAAVQKGADSATSGATEGATR